MHKAGALPWYTGGMQERNLEARKKRWYLKFRLTIKSDKFEMGKQIVVVIQSNTEKRSFNSYTKPLHPKILSVSPSKYIT